MLLAEYNQEEHIKNEKNISYEEGREDVNSLNSILIAAGQFDDLKRATNDPEYQQKLFNELLSNKSKKD